MNCEICCSKFCFGDESLLWLWFIVIRNNKIKKIVIFDGITLENYVKRLNAMKLKV